MGNLENKIKDDLKEAMKAKQELKLSVLRMLVGAIRNKEISQRDGAAIELGDEQVLEVIRGELKKRRDSIDSYESAGRSDLAAKEKEEATVLEVYLPAQLSAEEIEKTIREVLADSLGGGLEFGMAMAKVMPVLKGRADGRQIGEILKKVLAN